MENTDTIWGSCKTILFVLFKIVIPWVFIVWVIWHFFNVSDFIEKKLHPIEYETRYLTERISELENGIKRDEAAIKKYALELERMPVDRAFDRAERQIDEEMYDISPETLERLQEVEERTDSERRKLYTIMINSRKKDIEWKKKELEQAKKRLAELKELSRK